MRKISEMKIRYILRYLDRFSKKRLAKAARISTRQLYRILQRLGTESFKEMITTKKTGRNPQAFNPEEVALVKRAYLIYGVAATNLEKLLERETGTHIPHNRIHKILKEENLVMELSRKRKNYNWVRYEKERPNELWHTDWTELEYKGKRMQLIAFIDDYSRFIVGYGLFDNATTENALFVLRDAIALHGKPEAVMSDKGVQFYMNERGGVAPAKNEFQKFLEREGIRQITSKVKHPQSNGKIERFFGTVKQKLQMFGDIHEFMHWYNHVKPHMSLGLYPPITRFTTKKAILIKNGTNHD